MTTAYNINNANLMNYYPLDTDYLDYASGVGVSNATTSNVNIHLNHQTSKRFIIIAWFNESII